MGKREPDQGFFDDQEKLILAIIVGVILIILIMGSSCNFHIEIKQTSAKSEKTSP